MDDVQENQIAGQRSDPFGSQGDREVRNLIREAWANLPHIQQQAIELAYYEGLTDREIAVQLDQEVETVQTCIALGMSQLREALQSYWEQDEAV